MFENERPSIEHVSYVIGVFTLDRVFSPLKYSMDVKSAAPTVHVPPPECVLDVMLHHVEFMKTDKSFDI